MSYCRFMGGDVYLFSHVMGGIECCACRLASFIKPVATTRFYPCKHCGGVGCRKCSMHDSVWFYTRSEALMHLHEHRLAGHKVPQYAPDRLWEEIEKYGETRGLEPMETS